MPTNWEGIVKVQRSLSTSEPAEQCLIYNKTKTILHQQQMPDSIKRWFKGDEPKFYAFASYHNGELTIVERVGTQPW